MIGYNMCLNKRNNVPKCYKYDYKNWNFIRIKYPQLDREKIIFFDHNLHHEDKKYQRAGVA